MIEIMSYWRSMCIGALSILAIAKLIKWNKIKALKNRYFHGKTVLVTGASSGLGKAIAEELYPLGAQLIICARNKDLLEKLKADLIKSGPGKEPEVLCLDVASTEDAIKTSVDAMIEKFNYIDVLVNNAGVSYRGQAISTSAEVYSKIMNVNFLGAVCLTNLIVNHMIKDNESKSSLNEKRRNYSIVNIGSVQSYIGTPFRSAYCASKFALLGYSDSLRGELYSHRNIDVINCQPGYINTNVSINALTSSGVSNNVNDDLHRNGFDPNYVGQVVIDSILNRKREVIISIFFHKFAIWARFLFPGIFAKVMYSRARKMFKQNFND